VGQRPPDLFVLAAFAVRWTPAAIAWLDLASAATTDSCICSSGDQHVLTVGLRRRSTPRSRCLRGSQPRRIPERSVCETFIVVCVGLGAYWPSDSAEGRVAHAFGIGLFAGAAVVYKPNAGLYLLTLLL
jgi:hypothetical protein